MFYCLRVPIRHRDFIISIKEDFIFACVLLPTSKSRNTYDTAVKQNRARIRRLETFDTLQNNNHRSHINENNVKNIISYEYVHYCNIGNEFLHENTHTSVIHMTYITQEVVN